jgi:SAM-dependent methyltransferase
MLDQYVAMNTEERENVSYYDALASDYGLFFSNLNRNMEQEGDWLASVLQQYGAQRVLDASCGSGRQAVPLCKRGFDVTAADPSKAMLREAETTARLQGVNLLLLNASFADLSSHVHGDFDAVITMGNGLCNLERLEMVEQALRSMHACCHPGGVCLIGIKDFAAIRREEQHFHGHRIVDRADARTILFEVWDFRDPLLISTAYLITHSPSGGSASVRLARTREYMLYEHELVRLAGNIGFRAVRRLDHPNEAAYVLEK